MSITDDANSPARARVVAQGEHLSLLVEEPILGARKACRVQVALESRTYTGLGVSLDASNVLLVIDAPALAAHYRVGSSLALSWIKVMGADVAFERVRERLRSLADVESLGSLSDRAARHALLYILEARDLEVRRQRLDVLKAALRTEDREEGATT